MAKKVDLPTLSFQTYGSGPKVLLAFHGYDQSHRVYEGLAGALRNRYTVYSFDLFLHGDRYGEGSRWSDDHVITVKSWQESVEKFLKTHGIINFSLVGYSLGARFVLTLIEAMAPRIEQIILIAPDGIKSSRWYQLASGTRLGNCLLRHTVVRPHPFFWVLAKAYQLKLIEKSVLKFVEAHMNTRAKRFQVYTRWTTFRRIQPNLKRVEQACNTHRIAVIIFLGEFDAVVKGRAIEKFHESLSNSDLIHLPCGHAALIDEVASYYSNIE